MIHFTQGNLLEAPADALVNTVNEVGVMGKGIALMFRDAFPHNTEEYERAAKAKQVRVGKMFVTENPEFSGPRWIINFPTKRHWRQPSRLEWIRNGLEDLAITIRRLGIRSIAIPPLGCGSGGLDWDDVRPMILRALHSLTDVEVTVFEPTYEYQGKRKERGVEALTIARALIAELVRRYGALGLDCTILEIQKLAWFLSQEIDRAGLKNPLRLTFVADRYGPYDDRLRHLLDKLDGSFLHSAKRLADATPYDAIWFDDKKKGELQAYLDQPQVRPYAAVLDATARLIDGFESPFGMELLATVDWLLTRENTPPNVHRVRAALNEWPAGEKAVDRKVRMFKDRQLELALSRIVSRRATANGPLFE